MSIITQGSAPLSPFEPSDVHPFEGAEGLLKHVGNTPLVQIRNTVAGRIPDGVEIWAKLEGTNPGGSVKDRPALAMVLDARRRGLLPAGKRILDASSGNTGIAYAMIGAVLGHKLTLCLPRNANSERKRLLAVYGAEVVGTDPLEGSDGAILEARRLAAAHPERYLYLDQYGNEANAWAHYGSTGPEIWDQTEGRVTHFVCTLGTSGTFMGVTRYLREKKPSIQCVSVQPDSPFHGLEGLKHMETSIVPPIYDPEFADEDLGVPTEPAFDLVRDLADRDGILVGFSAGGALWGAIQIANRLDEGMIVTIFPDGGERYLSEAHIWERPAQERE